MCSKTHLNTLTTQRYDDNIYMRALHSTFNDNNPKLFKAKAFSKQDATSGF